MGNDLKAIKSSRFFFVKIGGKNTYWQCELLYSYIEYSMGTLGNKSMCIRNSIILIRPLFAIFKVFMGLLRWIFYCIFLETINLFEDILW